MKKLLIVRSVSFQQLDSNIINISRQFEDYKVHLLTHEHGRKLAEKYNCVDKIWIYPFKSGFKFSKRSKELKNEKFDVVIIPVTNISGVGFMNVFLFSLTIPTKRRYICNLVSDIKPLSVARILCLYITSIVYKIIATLLTALFGSIGFFILAFIRLFMKLLKIVYQKKCEV